MNYKEMDLKTFLKQLGVSETILNNNSFNNIISDLGLFNWVELREKIAESVKEDQYKNKVVTFNTKNNTQSNLVLNITPTGSLSTVSSVYGVNSFNQNIITNNLNEVICNDAEIITRNYLGVNALDLNGNVIKTLKSQQIEKNYSVKTGLQTLESEVRGINIIPGVSNITMGYRNDVVINESRIVRRTEIPNIAYAHCVKFDASKKQEANGYVELDTRNISRMINVFGENIDFNSLEELAHRNITVRASLSDRSKEDIINSAPEEIQELLKDELNTKIPLDYLESIKIDDSLNYNHHM